MEALALTPDAFQRQQWRWRNARLEPFSPSVRRAVLDEVNRLDATDFRAGNLRTGEITRELKGAHIAHAFDETAIRDHAENYARLCSRMHSLGARESFARWVGIEPPAGKSFTPSGTVARLDDPLWWRRQLRKRWTRAAENAMRDLGVVRKGKQPYASDDAVNHRAAQKRRAREFLERSQLTNLDTGEQLELLPIVDKSLANPAIRRAEFMTRVSGFESIAQDLGHVAEFVTLTAPSAFHAYLAAAGRNPLFQRGIVRDAQQWLCRMWARARAKLKRLGVLVYGFRIAEPHHDGTPHWHLLMFASASAVEHLRFVLRQVWLSDFAGEAGASRYRTRFETINPKVGSATGYVAKYVSKNIDGEGVIADDSDFETDRPIRDGIQRVAAWASIHGIRQFQQIGGPPVGLWREARRLRDGVEDPDIERARRCADEGDWRSFVACVGGIHAGRRTNIRIETAETGALNKYGECRPSAVVGLRCASSVVITRPHRWRIERKGQCARESERSTLPGARACNGVAALPNHSALFSSSSLGPVAITVRGASGAGEPSAWTNPNETSQAGPE